MVILGLAPTVFTLTFHGRPEYAVFALLSLLPVGLLVHEPARLAVTGALLSCDAADFLFPQRIIGLSKGNLFSHLNKPSTGGVVWVDKTSDRRPRTTVVLTEQGRTAVAEHWDRLMRLREAAERWNGRPPTHLGQRGRAVRVVSRVRRRPR